MILPWRIWQRAKDGWAPRGWWEKFWFRWSPERLIWWGSWILVVIAVLWLITMAVMWTVLMWRTVVST